MHIARLREKLADTAADSQTLLTVRGKGYMFRLSDQPLQHQAADGMGEAS